MKQIALEFKKLRHSKILLPMLILPLLSIVMGSINYYNNTGVLQSEWISLWTQVYLFYGLIFSPCLSAIYCAYLWNGEHKQGNFKLLLTAPLSYSKILGSKLIVAFCLSLFTQLYFFSIFMVIGSLFHFQSEFPTMILIWLVIGTLFSLANMSIQCYLSIKIKSFAIPVGIALFIAIASFLGASIGEISIFQDIFANASLTFAMNHYPTNVFTSFDYLKMTSWSIFIFSLFFILQKRELKQKLS